MGKHEYDISLCASAIRTDMWMDIYKSYMKNSSSIEVVFVGDKRPSYQLPFNFKFIYSEVKPTQCFEIAARNCNGKYINFVADDIFYEDGYFDNMLLFYKKQVNKFSSDKIITGGLHYFGKTKPRSVYKLWPNRCQPNQELPMDCFLTKKLYNEMGGIDRNFISLIWHFDVIMRIMEMGGKCIYSNGKYYECPTDKENHIDLSKISAKTDRQYFHSLWFSKWGECYNNDSELKKSGTAYYSCNKRGYIPIHRQKEFKPFSDNDILNMSQGTVCGKWDKNIKVDNNG